MQKTTSDRAGKYLYVDGGLRRAGVFSDARLARLTERHHIALLPPPMLPAPRPLRALANGDALDGAVIELHRGLPDPSQLRLARRILAAGRRGYFYWPEESAIECVDADRLRSFWRHLLFAHGIGSIRRVRETIKRPERGGHVPATPAESAPAHEPADDAVVIATCTAEIEHIIEHAGPVPLTSARQHPADGWRIAGTGAYLRTDFWAPISCGGSYGHTCYVAKELAAVTDRLVCHVANHYTLLDDLGIEQRVLPRPGPHGNEATIIRASAHYYEALRAAFAAVRPAYIYERLCLGDYVGARLSQELRIPYLVEYNGSEISMKRSFDGSGFEYETMYLKAEEAAFRQATIVSVISEVVKGDLVARGVPPERILVNPNGVDPGAYAPPSPGEKAALRNELGWDATHCVIGFTGTFGGWHGIDVLAATLPAICRRLPEARFLFIGDGHHKHLIDAAVDEHGLADRVRLVGRVPQREGARLLGACDIFVSTHNSHMVDSRFFGSPTKIFEYMAMGGAIVATDLEQIGEVLSPALRVSDLARPDLKVEDQRSVLCTPGDVAEFVDAVVLLAGRAEVCDALGRNARRAAVDQYAWAHHVARLIARAAPALATGDAYKDQAQRQWDQDPCGSHYVKQATPHSLDWFLEAERYRYGEYAPWMPETMEFAEQRGRQVLEIGAGMGTDLAQFAKHGAVVTDIDLSAGHLALAEENFRLRGLAGTFIHQDAERLPFDDCAFDLVYSNGVLHHTPNTAGVIAEICRVLKPGGRVIVMVYAERSLHYWRNLVHDIGLEQGILATASMGEIMSRHAELSANGARPLVKVYTRARLRRMFSAFDGVTVVQRQITPPELPRGLRWMSTDIAGRLMGWNLVIKAVKPAGRR